MDGCEGASGKHAAEHPNQAKDHQLVEYEGVMYKTTTSMLHCAKETFHELNQLKDAKATFYGDGLVQEMAKRYVPAYPEKSNIAGSKPALISAEYRNLNERLHHDNLTYGVGGSKHAPVVLKLAESLKTTSILDYGCGKGYLAKNLPFPIWEYDPAVPGKEADPRPADIIVCTDVLEHIEPEKLFFVLDDIRRCLRKVGYFVIHTGAAQKTLADGRNTHLIQKDKQWWKGKLKKFFQIGRMWQVGVELFVVVAPKVKQQEKAA